MKKVFVALVTVFALAGCSHYLVGKQLNSDACLPLQDLQNRHHVEGPHATFDYQYTIDEASRQIVFDGEVAFIDKSIRAGGIIQWQVTFLFCDENRKVIASENFMIYSVRISEKVAFKKSYDYKPEYRWIAMTYSGLVN